MPELTTRYHCRHIHLAGHRCGSPALRNENFCYYHHTTRKPAPLHKPHFKIQSLEDRAALQLSLTEVLNRISQGLLDPKTAGLLLYGLQIAANNLPRPTASQPTAETVEDFELTEQNEPVAPVQPFAQAPHERTLEEIFVEQWEQDKQTAALQQAEQAARRQADSEWIPTLQATTGSQAPEIQNPETEDSQQETIGYAAKAVAPVNIHPANSGRARNSRITPQNAQLERGVLRWNRLISQGPLFSVLSVHAFRSGAARGADAAKPPQEQGGFAQDYAGDHLISHTLTRAVPSAQRGLTSVFGMGTGVTLAVNSPANI